MTIWHTLRGDPILWIWAAVFGLVAAPYLLPVFDAETMSVYSLQYAEIPIIIMVMIAIQSGLRKVVDETERRFWNLWALGFGFWLAVRFLMIAVPREIVNRQVDVAVDVLFLMFYLCIVLSLDLRANGKTDRGAEAAKNRFQTLGFVTFLFGLLTYFALIPMALSRDEYETVVPSLLQYAVLDLYVVISLVYVRWRCRSAKWRSIYAWLFATAVLWFVTDVVECLQWLEVIPWTRPGEIWDLAWLVPFANVAIAARLRRHEFPDEHDADSEIATAVETAPLRKSPVWGGPLVIYALAFPILHFSLHALNIVDPASRGAREIVTLGFLIVLLATAYSYDRLLERENRELDRRRLRAERLRSMLATAIEQTTESVVITDTDGIVEYVNPAFEITMGGKREDVVGKSADFLDDASSRRQSDDDLYDTVRAGGVWEGQFVYATNRGSVFEGEGSVSPVRDEKNEIVRFVTVMRDVSSERNLERQLAQARKMEALGTLAGGVAHDFNNILLAIYGYCELSREEVPKDSVVYENLASVLRAADRARSLVNQILTFSRGEGNEARCPTDMYKAVHESLSLLRATLPSTIEIRQKLDESAGNVLADANQIQQVILNLGANAAHAMRGERGVLEVSLARIDVDKTFAASVEGLSPGPHIRLMVGDDGCGMDEDTLARIFDPFFTTKEVGEGTGLGLSVAHGIISGHGGAVRVESEPGNGSTFYLFFPCCEAGDHKTGGGGRAGRAGMEGGSERILVVDDEPELARLVHRGLGRLGYVVTALDDSATALEVFRSDPNSFDAVVTDQTMPRYTGMEMVRELREVRSEIPVVLTTGFNAAVTPEATAALGIATVLMKPYSIERLACALRDALGTRATVETGLGHAVCDPHEALQ